MARWNSQEMDNQYTERTQEHHAAYLEVKAADREVDAIDANYTPERAEEYASALSYSRSAYAAYDALFGE